MSERGQLWSFAVLERLVRWFFFGVLVAITPLIVAGLVLGTHPDDVVPAVAEMSLVAQVLSGGELLLVSAVIAGGAVGEVVGRGGVSARKTRVAAAGGAVVVTIACALWYADISRAVATGDDVNTSLITTGSVILFAASLVTAAACIALGEP